MRTPKKIAVRIMSPEEEQRIKDEAFLKLKPSERLRLHERLRKKIWGDKYNKLKLEGLQVYKRPIIE